MKPLRAGDAIEDPQDPTSRMVKIVRSQGRLNQFHQTVPKGRLAFEGHCRILYGLARAKRFQRNVHEGRFLYQDGDTDPSSEWECLLEQLLCDGSLKGW